MNAGARRQFISGVYISLSTSTGGRKGCFQVQQKELLLYSVFA
jgi:hypothetical protein